jgi:tetratricopeptide (TPR) repeat protein
LYLNGQPVEAEAALRRAWELEPENPDYRFAIALLEKAKGNWSDVFKHTQLLLETDPANRQYQMLLEESRSNLGLPTPTDTP